MPVKWGWMSPGTPISVRDPDAEALDVDKTQEIEVPEEIFQAAGLPPPPKKPITPILTEDVLNDYKPGYMQTEFHHCKAASDRVFQQFKRTGRFGGCQLNAWPTCCGDPAEKNFDYESTKDIIRVRFSCTHCGRFIRAPKKEMGT